MPTNSRHGMTKHPIYTTWRAMRNRCFGAKESVKLKSYKGKGIKICEEWDSFTNFAAWSLLNGYQTGLTIDRIDPNGDYCPENCRWANIYEQGNNKTNNATVEIDGTKKTISQLARIHGIPVSTMFRRHYRGITGKELIAPVNKKKSNKKLVNQ